MTRNRSQWIAGVVFGLALGFTAWLVAVVVPACLQTCVR